MNKNLYSISFQDPATGRMTVLNIVAGTMAAAITAAQQHLSIDASAEPHTAQKLASIDLEA